MKIKRMFDCDCIDEFGNPLMIKDTRQNCDHSKYNKECKYCEDVYNYIGWCGHEGYIDFDIDTEWKECVSYYKKWYGYEPEYEDEPTDSEMEAVMDTIIS